MRKAPWVYRKGISFIVLLCIIAIGTIGWMVWRTNSELQSDNSKNTISGKGSETNQTMNGAGTWRLEDMYASALVAEADAKRIEEELSRLKSRSGQLTVARELKLDLMSYFQLLIDLDHLNVYANLLVDSQLTNESALKLKAKAEALSGQLSQEEALLKASFLNFSKTEMGVLINDGDLSPIADRLSMWRSDAQWHENVQLSNSLSAFDQLEPKLVEPYTSFWKSAKASYNLSDFNSTNDDKRYQATLESISPEMENRELLASILESKVSFDNERAKAYGYNSALELTLAQDGLSPEAFNQMREIVKRSKTLLQKWTTIQKNELGLDRSLMAHDKQMTWYKKETVDFKAASSTLSLAVKPYGESYGTLLNQAFKGQWIDVYPRESKSESEYTWGSYKTHPYVMLQYTDDVYSAATLAHEMGHAMNNELSRTSQGFDYATNGTLKAEIAATVSELLMLDELSKSSDKEIAYEAQVEAIKTLTNTLFFQMLATEFEIRIHDAQVKGEDLNANFLSSEWKALIQETYGPDYEVSELDAYGWAHLDHLYWQYYMYKYAIGAAAGIYIEEKLLEGDKDFTDAYLKALATGSSVDTIGEFKAMGVDLTSPELLKKAMDSLQKRLTKLETESKNAK